VTLEISTPALLFPAVSLLFLSYTNRFLLFLPLLFLVSCGGLTTKSDRRYDQATSDKVIRRVNQERADRGLPLLTRNPGLAQMASQHAARLAGSVDPTIRKPTRAMAHQGFKDRAARARSEGYLVLSEVVMVGYAGNLAAVADRSVKGWLSSSLHRAAILHPDRRLIGVASRILEDGRYFTVGLLSNGRLNRPISPKE
jgi:uncharacterized protein YkwD